MTVVEVLKLLLNELFRKDGWSETCDYFAMKETTNISFFLNIPEKP